ncbi:MAG TPA: class II histone deacetylase [Pseudomonadales bacterium]|nr:class II histone deacetylase [Pseudomonadales bacterium]
MQQRLRRTGFVWHERYMWHDTGSALGVVNTGIGPFAGRFQPGIHAENAETKRRLKNLLDARGVTEELVPLAPFEVEDEVLLRFHTPGHVQRVGALSHGFGGDAGDSAPVGPGSDAIARLAVGGAIRAIEAVTSGAVDNAYVLSRPPGHHAVRDAGMGFCLYGNIALSILHALATGEVGRVAVVDWDVHHGNGTEQAFHDRDDVLTISLHQDMLYPFDTGSFTDCGAGAGQGFNINVPLPPGSGGGAWLAAMDRVVLPALVDFRPDLIVVACGFDGSYFDPLSHQMLLSTHYAAMMERVRDAADALCHGRIVACHEGGYSDFYVPLCGMAVIDVLRNAGSDLFDPYTETANLPWQALQPHQEAVIDAVAAGPLALLRSRV